jgi:hypothetical protein
MRFNMSVIRSNLAAEDTALLSIRLLGSARAF